MQADGRKLRSPQRRLLWLSFLRYILVQLLREHGVASVASAVADAATRRRRCRDDGGNSEQNLLTHGSPANAPRTSLGAGVAFLNALLTNVLFAAGAVPPPTLSIGTSSSTKSTRNDSALEVTNASSEAHDAPFLIALLGDVCAPHAAYRLTFWFSRFLQAHAVFRYEVLNAMHYVQSLGGGWASVRRPKQSQACARLLSCLGAMVGDDATVRKCQVFEGYALMWRGKTGESARVFRRAQRDAEAADDEVNYWRGHSGLRWLGYWLDGRWRREGGMGDLVQPEAKQRFV